MWGHTSFLVCIMFCRLLFVLLSFFFWSLYYLSFLDLLLLITPLVSSNFFYGINTVMDSLEMTSIQYLVSKWHLHYGSWVPVFKDEPRKWLWAKFCIKLIRVLRKKSRIPKSEESRKYNQSRHKIINWTRIDQTREGSIDCHKYQGRERTSE